VFLTYFYSAAPPAGYLTHQMFTSYTPDVYLVHTHQMFTSHTTAVYLVHQRAAELGLEDVTQRDPVQEAEQRLQRGVDQRCILGVFLHRRKKRQT